MQSIRILAGAKAKAHIDANGLSAHDISAVVAAAGGPKGLALIPLDHFIFDQWLPSQPRARQAYGASIGAWRMAAGTRTDSSAALDRFANAYLERQRYPNKPSATLVSTICRQVVSDLIGVPDTFIANQNANWHLNVVTAQSKHYDSPAQMKGMFIRAALRNTASRQQLSAHLKRFIFELGTATSNANPIPNDAFGQTRVQLTIKNLEDALLSSGTIPLVADPVTSITNAPSQSLYWDGGLVDYHLYWPWQQLDGLVLYPHFSQHITAGWLDKFLPWRRHGVGSEGKDWLSNVIAIIPSNDLLTKLPNKKIPDRNDFYQYGEDHDRRIRDWRLAMRECQRMSDDFAAFIQNPSGFKIESF